MKTVRFVSYVLLPFSILMVSCQNNKYSKKMNDQTDSGDAMITPPGFFLPPPLSPNETAKTLIQWFANQSKLCDTIAPNIACIFRLFKTPDKNYAVFLTFARRSQNEDQPFDYLSSIGNSYKLPGDTKSLTFDEILEKVTTEYQTFSRSNRQAADVYEKAESVNATVDNYHIAKLYSR